MITKIGLQIFPLRLLNANVECLIKLVNQLNVNYRTYVRKVSYGVKVF